MTNAEILTSTVIAAGIGSVIAVLGNWINNRIRAKHEVDVEMMRKLFQEQYEKLRQRGGRAGVIHAAQFEKEYTALQRLWDSVQIALAATQHDKLSAFMFRPVTEKPYEDIKKDALAAAWESYDQADLAAAQAEPFVSNTVYPSVNEFIVAMRALVMYCKACWAVPPRDENMEAKENDLRSAMYAASEKLRDAIRARASELYTVEISD